MGSQMKNKYQPIKFKLLEVKSLKLKPLISIKPNPNYFKRKHRDSDFDGVPDYKDCRPHNPYRQDDPQYEEKIDLDEKIEEIQRQIELENQQQVTQDDIINIQKMEKQIQENQTNYYLHVRQLNSWNTILKGYDPTQLEEYGKDLLNAGEIETFMIDTNQKYRYNESHLLQDVKQHLHEKGREFKKTLLDDLPISKSGLKSYARYRDKIINPTVPKAKGIRSELKPLTPVKQEHLGDTRPKLRLNLVPPVHEDAPLQSKSPTGLSNEIEQSDYEKYQRNLQRPIFPGMARYKPVYYSNTFVGIPDRQPSYNPEFSGRHYGEETERRYRTRGFGYRPTSVRPRHGFRGVSPNFQTHYREVSDRSRGEGYVPSFVVRRERVQQQYQDDDL